MENKKVLIFSHEFYPKIGGISSYLEELLKGLSKQKAQITLLTWAYRTRFIRFDFDQKLSVDDVIKIKRIFNVFHYYLAYFQYFLFNKNKLEKYDAILLADTTSVKFAMYFFSESLRKKTTIVFHGGELKNFYHNVKGVKRKFSFRSKFVELLNEIKLIVTVSEFHRNEFIKEFPELNNKIIKIYHGINQSEFKPITLDRKLVLRKHLHLDPQNLVMISASRLVKNKGQIELINFFARLIKLKPDCTLIIAGDGPEKIQLVKLANNLGISNKIKFTDGLSRLDLIKYLNASDVFVQLSTLPETFGMVYIEAALLQLPAIGISVGGVSEAVEDGKSGYLIQENDYDSFRNCLFKVLQDKENEMGKYARERAELIFNNERMANETLNYLIK